MCERIPQDGVLFPGQPNSAFVDITIKPNVFINPTKLNELKMKIAATPIRQNPPYTGQPSDSIMDFAGRLSQTLPSNDFAVVFGVSTDRFEEFMQKPLPEYATTFQPRVSMDGKHRFPSKGGDISFHIKSGVEAEKQNSIDQMINRIERTLEPFVASIKDDISVLKSFNGSSGRNQFGFFDAGSNPKVTANPILPHGPKVQAYPDAHQTLDFKKVPKEIRESYTSKEVFESLEAKEDAAKQSRESRTNYPDMGTYSTTFVDQADHVAGTFQLWQKWIHNGLDTFQKLPSHDQDAVFGREKASGKFIQDVDDPLNGGINKTYPNAHIVRAHIRMTDTKNETADVDPLVQNIPGASLAPLQINRQASSFVCKQEGSPDVKGLNFIAYAKDTKRFDQILDRMIGVNMTWPLPKQGHAVDSLLHYSTATTGKYYYVPSVTELEAMTRQGPDENYEVVVVGGGVSGLFCALRLKENNPNLKIGVFERATFLGGRLISIRAPEPASGIVCEFGGMRIPTNKDPSQGRTTSSLFPYTNTMVDRLGLDTVPFPVDADENPALVRGRLATQGDIKAPKTANGFGAKQLFHIPHVSDKALEQGMYPALIEHLGYNLKGFDASDPLKMKALRMFLMKIWVNELGNPVSPDSPSAVRLRDLSINALWLRVYGMEAFMYQRFAVAYYSPFGNWGAVDALVDNLSDFVDGVTYVKLKDGYASLVTSMGDEFTQLGGEVFLNRSLDSFFFGDRGFELSFNGTPVFANKLILAMPGAALAKIESPLLRQPSVLRMMETVEPRPFFKMFLVYNKPWWNDERNTPYRGRAITDTPIKQAYFWDIDKTSGKAVVMLYDDGISPRFWSALADLWENEGKNQQVWTLNPSNLWVENKASSAMKQEAHRQFAAMFKMNPKSVPPPIDAAYSQWTSSTVFGGGVNFWLPGVDSQQIVNGMMNPIPEVPLYVTGSCYSNYQGWAEGALQVADDMLKEHFGIKSIVAGMQPTTDELLSHMLANNPLFVANDGASQVEEKLEEQRKEIEQLKQMLDAAKLASKNLTVNAVPPTVPLSNTKK